MIEVTVTIRKTVNNQNQAERFAEELAALLMDLADVTIEAHFTTTLKVRD